MRLTRQTFTQQMHCCGRNDMDTASLDLAIHDGGGGEYIVLNATEWAMDKQDDVDALYHALTALLAGCRSAEDAAPESMPALQGVSVMPRCPGCGDVLNPVRYIDNAKEGYAEWAINRMGDYYCTTCRGNRFNKYGIRSEFCYFWAKEVAETGQQTPSEKTESNGR